MATALQDARKGEIRPRTITLKADGAAINLTGVTAVQMIYRVGGGSWTTLSTADTSPKLVITSAANGQVTFTPDATFWAAPGLYTLYFKVIPAAAADAYTLPDTDTYTVEVTEGA